MEFLIITIIKNTYSGILSRVLATVSSQPQLWHHNRTTSGLLAVTFSFPLSSWLDDEANHRHVNKRNGIQWTLMEQLYDLDFADDVALLSHKNRNYKHWAIGEEQKEGHGIWNKKAKVELDRTHPFKRVNKVHYQTRSTRESLAKEKRRNHWKRNVLAEMKAEGYRWQDMVRLEQIRNRWRNGDGG